MKAIVKSYRYYQSTPAEVSSGHKKGDVPWNAVAGGNGTYVIAGEPPRVIVDYVDENGQAYSLNVYGSIKFASTRRVTLKYVDYLMAAVIGQEIDTETAGNDIMRLMASRIQ